MSVTARLCSLLLPLSLAAACSRHAVAPAGDADGGGLPDGGCIAAPLLGTVGKQALLVGASMADATASAAAWDVRYQYVAGGLNDSSGPCASCATNCTSSGHVCTNASGGCAWWGCYQFDQDPPGAYARTWVKAAKGRAELPMLTYYELLQGSGVKPGAEEVTKAARDAVFMARYLNDFRFLLQQIGADRAILQIEPDFWGFAQAVNQDPHALPAAVASANSIDCAAEENSIAGLGRCLIAMSRKYAPGVLIGLHGSSFATGVDSFLNVDPSVDVAVEGKKLGAFLLECGSGGADFVTIDASDRDTGYYASIGRDTAWDASNTKLPHFHQAFAFTKALAETVGKPIFFWQVPVGNASQSNVAEHWKDNRVDYFLDHTAELAAAHVAGIFFGAGAAGQTTPESDGGHLLARIQAYLGTGGQPLCSVKTQ